MQSKFKYLAIRDSIYPCLRVTLSILGKRPIPVFEFRSCPQIGNGFETVPKQKVIFINNCVPVLFLTTALQYSKSRANLDMCDGLIALSDR